MSLIYKSFQATLEELAIYPRTLVYLVIESHKAYQGIFFYFLLNVFLGLSKLTC